MANKSHYYADKILEEHPSLLYAVSEDVSNGLDVPLGNLWKSSLSTAISGKILSQYNDVNNFGFLPQINSAPYVLREVAPIVYGSEKSIYIKTYTPSVLIPTITIPALGFLNSYGRYGTYTLEFWTKIEKPYSGRRKIVGPYTATSPSPYLVDDGNGLYINQTSFILQIGSKKGTAYIKDFNRPFLIHIVYSENNASLIVNGEILISLDLEESDINNLPNMATSAITTNDFITFGPGTYDCIALFPYRVDADQAKLRFAYGQAVPFKEDIVSRFGGKSIVIDYSKSNYANNYNFPGTSNWKQSINDNLDIKQYSLSNFKYDLPTFNCGTKTLADLESTGVFNLKQTSPVDWSSITSNFQFNKLNMMNSDTKGFYIHGYYSSLPSSEQIMFKLINRKTGNTFTISANGSTIYYKLKYDTGTENTIYSTSSADNLALYSSKYNFIIGIDIEAFVAYGIDNFISSGYNYGKDLKNFFSNSEDISVFVAGNNDLSVDNTLSATIRSVKFLTKENLLSKPAIINAKGEFYYPAAINTTPSGTAATQNNITGSYELEFYNDTLETVSSGYHLTVASSGYWKHDIPLTHFAKYVTDASGNKVYTLDFMQFNVDYESSLIRYTDSGKTYLDSIYSERSVKAYVTFEPLNSTYQSDSVFTTVMLPESNRVVSPTTGWETTKYQVMDNFVIYPPTGIDITQYTMVIHLNFDVDDTVNNVINIQKMQVCSRADNAGMENPIGTKFGSNIIPYTWTSSDGGATKTYNYKAYNPYLINKKENPHIYMARDSGIRLAGVINAPSSSAARGLKIKINKELNASSNINVLQMSVFYDSPLLYSSPPQLATFPNSSEQIFEINSNNRNIKFYLTRTTNGETARISAISNETTNQDIAYYINGQLEEFPTIVTNKWYNLSIVFSNPLIFDSAEGEFALVGGISIDNISYYQFTPEQIARNGWQLIVPYTWDYVSTTYTWASLPNLSAVSIEDTYSMFTGTNKKIVDSGILDNLNINDAEHAIYTGITSSTNQYSAL